MLSNSPHFGPRGPRRWAIAVVLAVLAAGVTVRPAPVAAQAPPVKPVPPKPPAAKPPAPETESIKALIEKLRRDAAGDPEAMKKIEELEKTLEKKAAPEAPPPSVPPRRPVPQFPQLQLPGLIRPPGAGDDPFDLDALEKELVQQQEMMRKMLEGLVGQIGAAGNRGVIVGGNINVGQDGRVRVLKALPTTGGGRLGAQVEKPTDALAAQLDLPNGQGLVCLNVPADSTAGRAGIRPHDVLFEVNGRAVPSDVMEFIQNLTDVKADQAVDIVVLRKGKKETFKNVKLPAAKAAAELPAFPAFPQLNLDVQPLQAPPAFPVLPGGGGAAPVPPPAVGAVVGPGETVRVERVNDAFTVFYEKNGIKVTVTGSKDADGVKAEGIEVQDGSKTAKAESIDKLPKEYQELAKAAMKQVK